MKKIEQRAERVVEWFQDELSKLRGGSASAGMLDSVPVQAYGDTVPLSQLAQVALKQGNTLVVSPFDPSVSPPPLLAGVAATSPPPLYLQLCADIDKAIRTTDLGLNPSVNNGSLRVPVPKASKETRAATVKQLTKLEETAKQRVRKVRQTGIDRARKYGKEDGVSQDEAHALEQDIDTMAKRQLEQLAEMAKARKAEIAGE